VQYSITFWRTSVRTLGRGMSRMWVSSSSSTVFSTSLESLAMANGTVKESFSLLFKFIFISSLILLDRLLRELDAN